MLSLEVGCGSHVDCCNLVPFFPRDLVTLTSDLSNLFCVSCLVVDDSD